MRDLAAILAAVFARGTLGAPAGHEIKQLPGWPKAELASKVYAGYIDAGSDTQDGTTYKMHEHYMFVECEEDPANKPVLLWTNGGPGASSFFGAFVELGPYILEDASFQTADYNATGVPTLFYNPFGWQSVANLLIINSPPPVGYSYCNPAGPSGKGDSCGSWNDTRTALHNYEFLINWFEAYPEYKSNELYLSGESYAGVYVPTLARLVYEGKRLNLAGFAVGDGVLGRGDFGNGWNYLHVLFFHGHGQFSDLLYDEIVETCTLDALKHNASITDPACNKLLDQVDDEVGGYYSYNLYDDCTYENNFLGATSTRGPDGSRDNSWEHRRFYGPPGLSALAQDNIRYHARLEVGELDANTHGHTAAALDASGDGYRGGLNDYPCGGNHALTVWVNHPLVKKALHVAPDAYFFSGDNGAGFTYNATEPSLLPFYRKMQASPIRVLIYNGDTDPGLNSFLGQNWTRHMGFDVEQSWRPWTTDGKQKMGGYVTRYANDFDYLTIRGSGHMVPEFKPAASKSFLLHWLKKEDWPKYKSPPKFRTMRSAEL